MILLVGENPLEAYWALLRGMFAPDRIPATLGRSTPFIGAALGVAFAFRAGLFNIGVEGQLLIGATAAAWVGTWAWVADVPAFFAVIFVLAAGVVGGGLYGAIPGALKARTGRPRGDHDDHAQQHRHPLRAVDGRVPRSRDPARHERIGPADSHLPERAVA